MTQDDIDREDRLDRDSEKEVRAFSFPSRRPALTSRGTLRELLLARTDADANAAGLWRPGDSK